MDHSEAAPVPWFQRHLPKVSSGLAAAFIFLVVCAVILSFIGYRWGDDEWFLEMVRKESFRGFLTRRYLEWSARSSIEGMIALTIERLWLWRLLNGFVLAGMLWLVSLYIPPRNGRNVLPLWCAGFLLMDAAVLHWTVWWITGSYNYFWPAVAALMALLPFVRPRSGGGRWFLLSMPAAWFAGFHEQTVLLMLGFMLVFGVELWRRQCLTTWHVVQFCMCLAILVFMLASPGNSVRLEVELRWFPGFETLGLKEKLFEGWANYLSHVFVISNSLTGLWLLMLAWLTVKIDAGRKMQWLMVTILCAYVLMLIAPWVRTTMPIEGSWADWMTHTPAYMPNAREFHAYSLLDINNRHGMPYWGRLFAFSMVWFSAVYATFLCLNVDSRQRALFAAVAMVAGGLAATVVGLSPTIYGSGQRVFFFGELLQLIVCCLLFQALPPKSSWPWWFWGVVGMLSIYGAGVAMAGGRSLL